MLFPMLLSINFGFRRGSMTRVSGGRRRRKWRKGEEEGMLENFDELAAIFGGERPPFPRNSFCGPREEGFFSMWTMVESMMEIFITRLWRFDTL